MQTCILIITRVRTLHLFTDSPKYKIVLPGLFINRLSFVMFETDLQMIYMLRFRICCFAHSALETSTLETLVATSHSGRRRFLRLLGGSMTSVIRSWSSDVFGALEQSLHWYTWIGTLPYYALLMFINFVNHYGFSILSAPAYQP